MRANLPHPLAKRRRSHPHPHKRTTVSGRKPDLANRPDLVRTPDPAVQRVRHAGGPIDHASYSCECGYMFIAAVSTTVACPNCRAPQVW